MNKTFGALAALAVATAIGGVAVAQTAAPEQANRAAMSQPVSQADFVQRSVARLRAADADRDGTVTVEEMRASRQARTAERRASLFDRLDADKDGVISRAEFEARGGERGPRAARGDRAGRPHHGRRMAADAASRRAPEGRFPIVIAEAERKAGETFARLDADGDGSVSVDERRAAHAEMRQKRQERRAEGASRRTAASPSAPASE